MESGEKFLGWSNHLILILLKIFLTNTYWDSLTFHVCPLRSFYKKKSLLCVKVEICRAFFRWKVWFLNSRLLSFFLKRLLTGTIPVKIPYWQPDLEKAASGACGHFVGNPVILRPFLSNFPYFWLRMEKEGLKKENWGWLKVIWVKNMENRGLRMEN